MSARGAGKGKAKGSRRKPGRYASRRRIPWIPLTLGVGLLVGAVLLARGLEIGAPGQRQNVSGVGQHVAEGQTVQFDQTPPAGGAHWPSPASWGLSSAPIPDERAVHNLEHGGVVVSYNALATEDLARLRQLLVVYPRDRYNEVKVVVRPYDRIPSGTLVLAAWGWTQPLSGYDEALVRAFLDAHLNRCCESLP